MDQEYKFRVLRGGVFLPGLRFSVRAESLESAQKKVKLHLRRGVNIAQYGCPEPRGGFTVDGAKLTTARIEEGYSMDDVASKIGGNKSNLSRWERGIVHPSERAILKLAMLLNRGDFIKER
jgi:DNA-binding XRE family transcriptional regulator